MSQDRGLKRRKPKVAQIWSRLIEPPASITEPGRRQRARLLAALLVCMIPLVILAGIVTRWTNPAPSIVHDPAAAGNGIPTK